MREASRPLFYANQPIAFFFAPSTLIPYPDGHDDHFQGELLGLSLGW